MGMDWGPHQAREERPRRIAAARFDGGGPLRPYEQRAFTIGNVVGESLSLYRRFFLYFSSIALAVFLVTSLVGALALLPDNDTTAAVIIVAGILVGIVGFYFVQGALALAVDDVRDGHVDLSPRELVFRAARRVPSLFALGLFVGIVLGIPSYAVLYASGKLGLHTLGVLVVAAVDLFFVTRWVIATPIVVLDGLGPVEGVLRSWSLVRGHGVRVVSILFITLVMAAIGALVLSAVLSALLSDFLYVWLGSAVVNGLTTPFLALAWTLMYFHLRPLPSAAPSAATAIPAGAAYTDS